MEQKGSITAAFVPNSVATFEEKVVGVQSASFTGTTAEKILVTGVSYDKASVASATFTGKQADITATFTGTEGDVAVSGKYAKASVESATFSGTEETLAHKATKGDVAVNIVIE